MRELRGLIGIEINERIAQALGADATPDVLDALSLAWSGAMLQAGMGYYDYAQMSVRLATTTRLIVDSERG